MKCIILVNIFLWYQLQYFIASSLRRNPFIISRYGIFSLHFREHQKYLSIFHWKIKFNLSLSVKGSIVTFAAHLKREVAPDMRR